jgi:alpha/beta hydrolase fold
MTGKFPTSGNGPMIKRLRCIILCWIVCLAPSLVTAESWLYEDGTPSTFAAILCHGKGGDPESYVVDPLRLELNEQLGYHTVSLQMPGGRKALLEYEEDFPEAFVEINRAADFLQKKGVTTIYLVAHSLGSRMATAYLTHTPHPSIKGFVGVGMLNNGEQPFNCLENLQKNTLPVLDIWGEAGRAGDNRYGLERKGLLSPVYTQVSIKNGDHALSEHEDELVEEVVHWLTMQDKIQKDELVKRSNFVWMDK